MATHSSILAWRIPWTEEPGRLQSMGSHTHIHIVCEGDWGKLLFCMNRNKLHISIMFMISVAYYIRLGGNVCCFELN